LGGFWCGEDGEGSMKVEEVCCSLEKLMGIEEELGDFEGNLEEV
jgi:hypothetical protein